MKEWYLNITSPDVCSGYESDEINEYGVSNFSDVMYTNFSNPVIKCNYDNTTKATVNVIIQGAVEDSITLATKRQLLCNIGSFQFGDYVYFENNYWLVVANPSNNKIHEKVLVESCTYILKFQSPTGTILSYPCIDDASSTIGVDVNNTITTLNGIHHIKLPFDDNTKLIGVDRRFFLDKVGTTTYKVTNVNNTTYSFGDKGLIELTLQQDSAYNPTTDINGVCDYFEPTVTPPTPDPTGYILTIVSSGDFNLGTTRTLTPTLKDSNGEVASYWIANWTVDYNGMAQSYFIVTYVGNQCKVTISDEAYDCIDGILKLTCTVAGDTVSADYSGIITA